MLNYNTCIWINTNFLLHVSTQGFVLTAIQIRWTTVKCHTPVSLRFDSRLVAINDVIILVYESYSVLTYVLY